MAELTVYSSASAVAGFAGRHEVDQTFADLRAGAGTISGYSAGDATEIYLIGAGTGNQFRTLYRAFILFDTSALGAGSIINSATLSIYGTAKDNSLSLSAAHAALALVGSTPASNTALENSDYGQLGTTRFSDTDIAYASFNTSAYNAFALNASGLAAISQTGISKFGVKYAVDQDAGAPNWIVFPTSSYYEWTDSGGTNKPKLVIDYTPASSGFLAFM